MKVIDLINMINNKENLPEKMIINKRVYHSSVFRNMIYEEDCNTDIWMAIKLQYINLNDEVELIEEEQDIDIQALKKFIIPELRRSEEADMWADRITINKLIQAVKQLDRKIREER